MNKAGLVLMVVSLMLNGFLLTRLLGIYLILDTTQKRLVEAQTNNTMVWQMDSSCFNQIKNSIDGIIRIKINK